MAIENHQNYHIAVKAFIRNGDKLLICKDAFFEDESIPEWDLPGGRINKEEFLISFEDILKREINEEVGDIKYKNNGVAVIFRHRRSEQRELKADVKPIINILMIGFDLEYLGGDIKISDEHTEYKWLPVEELNDADKYFKGGLLDGVKKYQEYLKNNKSKLIY
jgi:8-oxo-dGTP pyrophosphatase MutT (NUDIX family)